MLAFLLAFVQAGAGKPLPSTVVTAADIQATTRVGDTPIRTIDAGGHHVGIALVRRLKATNLSGGSSHTKVTEVYYILEGVGTLATGGMQVSPKTRDNNPGEGIAGPSIGGTTIQGSVSRRIAKGDVVIIPAGTPHLWTEIEQDVSYIVVRVDPDRFVPLK
jgi:mannose-6-phosphate isomerase-like protein (cupin superfamily)